MRLNLFGRHLHNQIVVPLVMALLVVGAVATVVAITMIGRVINEWIETAKELGRPIPKPRGRLLYA